MLTENDASVQTLSLLSDLDQQFAKASDAFHEQFHLPANGAVRCVRYTDAAHPIIEAYLEIDVSADFTLSFHLDVEYRDNKWTVSRSIRRDAVESDLVAQFDDLETGDVEGLRRTVLHAAASGFQEFERHTSQQLAA
jgi:hypothetical protein